MNQHRMIERGIRFSVSEKAMLKEHKLLFNKKAYGKEGVGYANIVADSNSVIWGVLYTVTSSLGNLDRYEGHPNHYEKQFVTVQKSDGTEVQAITYVARKEKVSNNLKPEQTYLNHLIQGARQNDFPNDYIAFLEQIETSKSTSN